MAQVVRQISYPIELTTAELAYLLGIVSAQTLIGGNNRELFPEDEAAREAQWQRGRARLEADGWLAWDAAAGHYRLNDELMLIIAALADPKIVVLSEFKSGDQQRGVGHYLSEDFVVEMAMRGQIYELLALPSPAIMVERLASTAGLPEAAHPEIVFELSREQASQAKQHPDQASLVAQGVPAQVAEGFAAAMRQPQRSATLTILRAHLGQAVAMRLLGVLVAGEASAWLAIPAGDEHVRYMLANRGDFEAALGALLDELRSADIETLIAAP